MKQDWKPCLHCGKKTMSKAQVCRACHVPKFPTKSPCVLCGRMTQRKDHICQPCTTPKDEPFNEHLLELLDDDDHGLGPGDWRFDPFRRVRVWVPKNGQTPPRRPSRDEVAIKRRANALADQFDDLHEEDVA